jgi:hypothetical protein
MPNYMKNGGEMNKKAGKTGKMVAPMAKIVMNSDEPTPEELKMMRQKERERKMDADTERGANQYEDTRLPIKKAKGGMVSKGNGIAIRGTRKCKMY